MLTNLQKNDTISLLDIYPWHSWIARQTPTLKVTSEKQLITVFREGSPQSKEMKERLSLDAQRLCDRTGRRFKSERI